MKWDEDQLPTTAKEDAANLLSFRDGLLEVAAQLKQALDEYQVRRDGGFALLCSLHAVQTGLGNTDDVDASTRRVVSVENTRASSRSADR